MFPVGAAGDPRWFIPALLAIILVGVALQWPGLGNEMLERVHGWRQAQTAMTSRNFVRDGMNPFVARVDYIGNGQMQLELPVYQYLVAICYKLFGINEVWGRIVAMAFGIASAVMLFLIGRMLFSARVGLLAAAVFSWSPVNVFFNRGFMPDSCTIFFALASVWGFLRYFRDRRGRDLVLSCVTVFLALAGKPPIALSIAPPLAAALFLQFGRSFWRQRQLAIGLLVAAIAFGGWMKFQSSVNNHKSDDLGIDFTNAGEFNQHLIHWYFGSPQQRSDPRTYERIFSRVSDWLGHPWPSLAAKADGPRTRQNPTGVSPDLGPVGRAGEFIAHYAVITLCLLGIALSWRTPMQWVLPAWFIGGLAYVLVFLNVNYVHNYYQQPIIPMLALAAAVGLDRVCEWVGGRTTPVRSGDARHADRGEDRARTAGPVRGAIEAFVIVLFLAGQAYGGYAVLRDYDPRPGYEFWQPGERMYWSQNTQAIDFGRRIHASLPDNGGLLAFAGDGRVADVRDPQVLYYVDRRGFVIQAPSKYQDEVRDQARAQRRPSTEAVQQINRWVSDRFPQILDTAIKKGVRTLVVVYPGILLTEDRLKDVLTRFRLHHRAPRDEFAVFDLTQPPDGGAQALPGT